MCIKKYCCLDGVQYIKHFRDIAVNVYVVSILYIKNKHLQKVYATVLHARNQAVVLITKYVIRDLSKETKIMH